VSEAPESSDFHQVLGIEPGNELGAFVSRLWDILGLDGLGRRWSEVAAETCRNFGLEPDAGFAEVLAAFEAHDGVAYSRGLEDLRRHDNLLNALLFVMARRQGATPIPPEWTPGSQVVYLGFNGIDDPRGWDLYLCEGIAFHLGQRNPLFDALSALARHLLQRGSDIDTAALFLWDTIGGFVHARDWGAVIDSLRLLDHLPCGHERPARVVADFGLLRAESAGARLAAAELLGRCRLPGFAATLRDALTAETLTVVAQAQVRALRRSGGEESFDALLDAARHASNRQAARLAARALAWVMDFPQRQKRIAKLCFHRDPVVQSIGATALADAKHHSVFSYGAVLAVPKETALRDAFAALMEERLSESQREMLCHAFEGGTVQICSGAQATIENGAVVSTKDDVIVLVLRPEHLARGRKALARVCPAVPF
jgi:hypothetical protein